MCSMASIWPRDTNAPKLVVSTTTPSIISWRDKQEYNSDKVNVVVHASVTVNDLSITGHGPTPVTAIENTTSLCQHLRFKLFLQDRQE